MKLNNPGICTWCDIPHFLEVHETSRVLTSVDVKYVLKYVLNTC